MKTCTNCGRTSPPALRICPRCKTPFGEITGSRKAEPSQSRSGPERRIPEGTSRKGGRTILIAAGAALLLVIAVIAYLLIRDSSGLARKGMQMVQKMQGREWKYPPGDEAATAKAMSVQQLIDAWETVPGRSQTSLHATYAKALGLKGREAISALPVLAPYVLDKDLYLRQGAMAGLAGIGEEGLPHLVKALKHPDSKGGDAVTIRWDAAMAIGKMGVKAKGAMQDLLDTVMDPQENPNVKEDAAAALAGIGSDAIPALNKARCWFYDQGGLSPSETGVLRTINTSLSSLHASIEPCQGLDGRQNASQTPASPSSSASMFLSAADLSRMQVPQLLEALRSHPYNTREIADELARKGAKAEAAEALISMLKEKSRTSDLGIKMALSKIGAAVTYDSSKNVFLPIAEDNIGYIDLSAETRGDSLYSSGRIYVGREVAAGLTRQQKGAMTVPTFVKYTLTVKGGSLGQPIEKIFEVNREGEHAWDNLLLASGLGKGNYSVSLFLHAQFAKEDGSGMILNNNAGFLEVER